MVINEKLLYSAGAEIKHYNSGEIIFQEGAIPMYYFQVIKGRLKLNNYTKDGKEFIQNIVYEGQSFGDSMLFMDKVYPMEAVALEPCTIFRLCKNNFFSMLNTYPQLYDTLCKALADRLYYQHIMLQANSAQSPAQRIIDLMDYLKSGSEYKDPFSFKVPLTRQQLANLTGVCVETAIRTIKNMEKNKIVKIKNRKIFF
ncbi:MULTISPECIES: Crp/Fnr family transcriptional regulator [Chryseobacterium]|uniref:Crp/Fnr family transcriptional regulator n=1 Tax=Chryseobacterium TaxID=59732 RepID=UPI0027968FEF|nr:Crp/Fnr family transcriptional regulator [Chryseobacterium sp. CKR4-1]MDQ1806140.1 Crp/Fnr family transcriptional regulator [Chryseobacterium sp. CKR4-1]WBV58110.1 Crp/Fnr family transcriptional regulator [Chryseobacterium daecheongense]